MEMVGNCSARVKEENVDPEVSAERSRLGKCEVCGFHNAKYTCPKCEVKTCGLRCSKIHKLELECDGVRDRTKFIALNKFSNMDLASDYRLLEEITRNIQSRKTFAKKFFKTNKELPYHLHKLKCEAEDRKTTLKFLPQSFEKRRCNYTQFNFASKRILWDIEWIFPNAGNLKIKEEKVSEMEKLSSVLNKYLVKQEDSVLQEKLQFYQSCDLGGIRVFMKAEEKPGRKFFELDTVENLKTNFRNKVIIEYPTLYVLLKEHADSYDVIDSDAEDEKDTIKSGKTIVDNIIKSAEKDEGLYKSLKNLLFISEYSDEELSDE